MTEMTLEVMEQVANGRPLTDAHQRWLLETSDLVQLGMVATDIRTRALGTRGTFVRVDVVPVDQAADWDIAPDAGEVRIVGVPASLDAALEAVTRLRDRATVPVTGFAVHDLALGSGGALKQWCTALKDAGLLAVASARADQVDDEWLAAVAAAGLGVQCIAAGSPVGGDDLLALLIQVREWQARHGVFAAFQPLALDVPVNEPSTGYDDMRAVVAARVLLSNIPHVQVDWVRAGAKLAQACLLFGADDIDGVPARDAMPHGPRRSILEEVRRNLVAVGLTPIERTPLFDSRASAAAPEASA